MARLFGLVGTRSDGASRVLGALAGDLRLRTGSVRPLQPSQSADVAPPASAESSQDSSVYHAPISTPPLSGALGWGIGFHASGEVLMRRKPVDDDAAIDFARLLQGVHAETLVAHVRSATVGALRPENTHPFRFRSWLFAQTGTLPGYAQVAGRVDASIPAFLRANVRGETDAERAFHLLLSHLEAAHALDEPTPGALRDAIRRTVEDIARWVREFAGEPVAPSAFGFNWMVAEPQAVTLLRLGSPAFLRKVGAAEATALFADSATTRGPEAARVPEFLLAATDFRLPPSPPWLPLGCDLTTLRLGANVSYEESAL